MKPPSRELIYSLIGPTILAFAFLIYLNLDTIFPRGEKWDKKIPILDNNIATESNPAPISTKPTEDIDPENPPALPLSPDREKFEAENKRQLKEANIPITELRSLYLSGNEKAAVEKVESTYREATPEEEFKQKKLLMEFVLASQSNGAYLSGATSVMTAGKNIPIRIILAIRRGNIDGEETNTEDSLASPEFCWKAYASFQNGLFESGHAACNGNFRVRDGNFFIVGESNIVENYDRPVAHFAIQVPTPDKQTSLVEVIATNVSTWASTELTWTKIQKSDFERIQAEAEKPWPVK